MNRWFTKSGAAALVVMLSGAAAQAQQALGTAFTYQGRLDQSGAPVNATADFQFSLFDAATAGNVVAGPISVNNVNVADGLFTASIDFGATAFNGQARWLSIAVRSPAGGGSFTTLTTRQKLTAAPYALKVPGIDGFSLDAADGSPTDALFVDSAGKIGIGTLAPTHSVHIATIGPTLALQDTNAASQQAGYVSYRDNANVERAWVGYGTPGSPDFSIINARSGGDIVLNTFGGGKVGIGTDTPTHSLHIANAAPTLALQDSNSTSDQVGYVSYRDSGNGERAWVGYGTPGSPHFSVVNSRSGGNVVLSALGAGGNVVLSPGAGGVVSVPVLEITGADLAEKFPASEQLDPGMVVAIDSSHSGKLCLSRGAYNRRVAGVVSGANNFAAGAVLGNMPGSEDAPPIALSGRVYVHCETAGATIQPGDLLTTSDTPGYAMKVTDHARAQGAIIGKAMTALESGRGMVLVLVSLQ
jgi:hypothetical protein